MADKVAHAFYTNASKDDGNAYRANYEIHKKGQTPKEVTDYYSSWAQGDVYENDLAGRYYGPEHCSKAVDKLYPGNKKNGIRLIDVAAGTGLLAEKLVKIGFQNSQLDALDPSEGMLAKARAKNVYNNFIVDCIDDHRLDIDDNTYDCLTITAGLGEGHIPSCAIYEMIRIVKPGGYVVILMREEYLEYVEDYKDLEPRMKTLEDNGVWKKIQREIIPKYSFGKNGLLLIHQIC